MLEYVAIFIVSFFALGLVIGLFFVFWMMYGIFLILTDGEL